MAVFELVEGVRELSVAVEVLVLADVPKHLGELGLEGLVAL